MKALQYMALGIPPVVSPVGANTTSSRTGSAASTARTDEEWCGRLRELLGSPALRDQLGGAARRVVVSRYSAQVHAPRVAELFRGLCDGVELFKDLTLGPEKELKASLG